MVESLEELHSYYKLHRDVKPDNFRVDENGEVFIIDFGNAINYMNDGKHIEQVKSPEFKGTLTYASIGSH